MQHLETTTTTNQPASSLIGGSRRWQQDNSEARGQLLITIITSTYNAARDLPWTINSIRGQAYPHIQWIVADGGSQDGTVDLLKQNEDLVDLWFSAPDKGIYDAWNKALAYARGDWVQFIGAGDELAEPDTLAKVAPYLATAHPKHDIVYGKVALISEGRRQLIEELGTPWEEMKGKWEGYRPMLPAHPGVFHHRSTFEEDTLFDTSYRIAGDSHFLMRQLKKKDFVYIPVLVDRMPIGGVSARIDSFKQSLQECRRSSRELGFDIPFAHLCYEHIKFVIRLIILKIFDENNTRKLFDRFLILVGKKAKWGI